MTKSNAMKVLKVVGKASASPRYIEIETGLTEQEVGALVQVLCKKNILVLNGQVVQIVKKFIHDVPKWKDMRNALNTIDELA